MYMMYSVYMIKHYTVATFRKQLREALNQADEGVIVTIDRYGSTYELTNMDNKPKKPDVQVVQTAPNVTIEPRPKNVQSVQIAKNPVSISNPTSNPTPDVSGSIPVKKTPEPFKFPPSAASGVIKTPEDAKKAMESPTFISKSYSARKKGSRERHVDL